MSPYWPIPAPKGDSSTLNSNPSVSVHADCIFFFFFGCTNINLKLYSHLSSCVPLRVVSSTCSCRCPCLHLDPWPWWRPPSCRPTRSPACWPRLSSRCSSWEPASSSTSTVWCTVGARALVWVCVCVYCGVTGVMRVRRQGDYHRHPPDISYKWALNKQ